MIGSRVGAVDNRAAALAAPKVADVYPRSSRSGRVTMLIDKQRIAAVAVLEALGFKYTALINQASVRCLCWWRLLVDSFYVRCHSVPFCANLYH